MSEQKYKPIIFTAPMVRAILEGRKTQTRRIVKVQPPEEGYTLSTLIDTTGPRRNTGKHHWLKRDGFKVIDDSQPYFSEPYAVGDRLWVKESFEFNPGGPIYDAAGGVMDSMDDELIYRADRPNLKTKWTSGRFMPRWASRITLEITGVRVERLQDISEDEVFAEGIEKLSDPCDVKTERAMKKCLGKNEWDDFGPYWTDPIFAYRCLWNSIHGPGAWDKNPWVWVIEFKRVEGK